MKSKEEYNKGCLTFFEIEIYEMDKQAIMQSFDLETKVSFTGDFNERDFIERNVVGIIPGKEEKYIGPAKHDVTKITNTELRDGPGHKYRTPFKQNFLQAEAPGVHLHQCQGLLEHPMCNHLLPGVDFQNPLCWASPWRKCLCED